MTNPVNTIEPDTMITRYNRGLVTYPDLVEYFKTTKFKKRPPTKGDWGDVYLAAEEGPDPFVVGLVLSSAKLARRITAAQYEELHKIAMANAK